MAGTLYLVSTPIGNLGDISRRCNETLQSVDFIAAEDTRVALRLLNHLQLKKPLISYYEHNRTESGEKILARLLGGESCALVTDAGTPAVSDPGEDLVRLCAEHGVEVIPIPGPCALISALAVSALATGRFTFEGFITTNKKNRRLHLAELKSEKRTMIFYEAPHKLNATLRDLLETLGNRRISICRELTKLYEETLRLDLEQAVAHFEVTAPRGEFVLVVEGASEAPEPETTLEDAIALASSYKSEGLSSKDAARRASEETGFAKNDIYSGLISGISTLQEEKL